RGLGLPERARLHRRHQGPPAANPHAAPRGPAPLAPPTASRLRCAVAHSRRLAANATPATHSAAAAAAAAAAHAVRRAA
ncbi:hypothetical protein LTR16_011610, partial [Cryomyces antarcticus]